MVHRADSSRSSILLQELDRCGREQRTGQVEIRSPTLRWILHCQGGRLTGDWGGMHPIRRWRRQLSRHCPQLAQATDLQTAALHRWSQGSGCGWHHLLQWDRVSPGEEVLVVGGSLQEVLFDCLQEENRGLRETDQPLQIRILPPDSELPLPAELPEPLRADHQGEQALQEWQIWGQSGLQGISPNLAPQIRDGASLRGHRSAPVFRRLAQMIDGHRTLRDLALKLGQETLALSQSLMPLVRQGSLQLIPVPDLGLDSTLVTEIKTFPPPTLGLPTAVASAAVSNAPLVAYVDERQINGQIVGQIVHQMGCRYLNIHDPLQMFSALHQYPPQLILIDLLMPITSGYEICAQIRRIPSLQSIPIALVASNSNLVDRVRARSVGASDIIVRPVSAPKVARLLHRHQGISSVR